jgi:hypothetical protein
MGKKINAGKQAAPLMELDMQRRAIGEEGGKEGGRGMVQES